jgi:hypothetical protein
MNGANTPWDAWNDFGGSYDASFWKAHFASLHASGVNSSRVWISCSGEVGIRIDAQGQVTGATPEHWAHLDDFLATAQEQGIYVMATLMSFDHFEAGAADRWLSWIQSDAAIQSYVASYVVPFVERYRSNPYLWSIDLMNEPDWVHEHSGVSWDRLRTYFSRAAKAIHDNSPILVTVGMAMPKYQTGTCSGCTGNQISDTQLAAIVPGAALDFYSPHHYDWAGDVWGNPLESNPVAYGYDVSKPYLFGEVPAKGTKNHTLTDDLSNAANHGYVGVMPWTSNGVDDNGGFQEVSIAAAAFAAQHMDLVFPACPQLQ